MRRGPLADAGLWVTESSKLQTRPSPALIWTCCGEKAKFFRRTTDPDATWRTGHGASRIACVLPCASTRLSGIVTCGGLVRTRLTLVSSRASAGSLAHLGPDTFP